MNAELLDAVKLAVKEAVKEEMVSTNEKLDGILESIKKVNERIDDVEKGLQFTSDRLNAAMTVTLPDLSDHVAKVAEALTKHHLQLEVHRRKWNLILHGIDGPAGEDGDATRKSCLKFAKEVLKVKDAENTHIAACRRLSKKRDAGVILRFCDLASRDKWLTSSSNLKGSEKQYSISPDLPHVLRPLKDSLMLKRSLMGQELKRKSNVRFLPQWPFVELRTEGEPSIKPDESLRAIVSKSLGLNHVFNIRESVDP